MVRAPEDVTPPYTEPFTYNKMTEKLIGQIEKTGMPQQYKPVEIGPGRFDPTPSSYPKQYKQGLGFSFAQSQSKSISNDDWGSSIDIPMDEQSFFNT